MIDLKLELKNYILENLLRKVSEEGKKNSKLKGLVLDKPSTKILASCFSMDELAAEGITFLDAIDKHREPYPSMDGVYLIAPTEANAAEVVANIKDSFFNKYHIFFIEACPQGYIENMAKRVAGYTDSISTLAELNTNFLPVEKQVFTLGDKSLGTKVFKSFYQPTSNKDAELGHHLVDMAEQLATLCSTLGECPTVRYWNQNEQNEMFANLVRSRIDEYKNDATDKLRWEGPTKLKAQLLIVDRGFDTKTCLLHDLTYQAMAYDLLEGENIDIDTHVFTKGASETEEKTDKNEVLDDKDSIWINLRHQHISKVLTSFETYVKEIKRMEESMKSSSKTNDLKKNMRHLPKHLKMKKDIGKHQLLAGKCFEIFNARLAKLCETEQNLATATDADGNNVSDSKNPGYLKFNEAFVSSLLDQKISTGDKIRLLMLYMHFKKGLPEVELKKYMAHANVPSEEKEKIMKLGHLDEHIIVSDNRKKREYKRNTGRNTDESLRHISRWTPVLKDVVEDLINNKLDRTLFPFLDPTIKDQELKPGALSNRRGSNSPLIRSKQVPRIIIFFLGGLTYSECRVAYEITQEQNNQWDILIGGTHLITPKLFLDNLSALDPFVPLTVVQKEKHSKELRKTIKRTSTQRSSTMKAGRKISMTNVFK